MRLFDDVVLRRLLMIALAVHVLAVWFSLGHYQTDEYTQLLEFAGLKLGLVQKQQLSFEYANQMRSGFQPFVVWVVVKLSIFLGAQSPYTWVLILRLLSALLSLVAVVIFFQTYQRDLHSKQCRRWTLAAMLLLWPIVFYNVRFSSEGWMSSFVLLGVAWLGPADPPSFSNRRCFLVGVVFAIAFLSRFQAGLMIISLGVWILFIQRRPMKEIAWIVLGGGSALLLGGVLDQWLYGEWVWSAWEYLQWHLANDSAQGGTLWQAYLKNTAVLLPPISILPIVILLGFFFKFPRHPVTWVVCLYLLAHCWTDNRQLRFLFPILVFLPLMAAMLWEKAGCFIDQHPNIQSVIWRLFQVSLMVNTLMLLFVVLTPASKEVKILRDCIAPHSIGRSTTVFVLSTGNALGELALPFYNDIGVRYIGVSDEQDLVEKIAGITDQATAVSAEQFLYASRKSRAAQLQENKIPAELLCRAIPEWLVKYVNFGDWASRASLWEIWDIKQ